MNKSGSDEGLETGFETDFCDLDLALVVLVSR